MTGVDNKADLCRLQIAKKPYYMKKQTQAAKKKRIRTLNSMMKDNKLDLNSYIANYAISE